MKKTLITLTLLLNFALIAPVSADYTIEYSPGFAIVDLLLYRPIGLAATAVGAGLYAGLSPLTALAQISPPHDAFDRTAEFLVNAPYDHTFSRPLGEWDYSSDENSVENGLLSGE